MTRILHAVYFVLAKRLADAGSGVHSFSDPFLVLKNFRDFLYDLLTLDIWTSQIKGIELYEEIGKIDYSVKVCFLTADQIYNRPFREIDDDLKENRFILKPIENKELIKRIDEITNSSRSYNLDRQEFLEEQEIGLILALGH